MRDTVLFLRFFSSLLVRPPFVHQRGFNNKNLMRFSSLRQLSVGCGENENEKIAHILDSQLHFTIFVSIMNNKFEISSAGWQLGIERNFHSAGVFAWFHSFLPLLNDLSPHNSYERGEERGRMMKMKFFLIIKQFGDFLTFALCVPS